MRTHVLDASAMGSVLLREDDEISSDEVMGLLSSGICVVPAHWVLEVGNMLVMAVRRDRVSFADSVPLMALALGFDVERHGPDNAGITRALVLAREHRLTLYDALYLDLAIGRTLVLVTLDKALRRAASAEGVALVPG